MCNQQSLRLACTYAQSDQSLCLMLEYSMSVKLLTEHHLEFLSLAGGCTGTSESIIVKMPHYWESHGATLIYSLGFYAGRKKEKMSAEDKEEDQFFNFIHKVLHETPIRYQPQHVTWHFDKCRLRRACTASF